MAEKGVVPIQKRYMPEAKRARRGTDTFKLHFGGFCGWENLKNTFSSITDPDTKIILLGLFKFGCRAMELPRLLKRQIDFNFSDTQIMVRSMYVEKQKERIALQDEFGNPILENGEKVLKIVGKPGARSFPIRKDEPLSKELENYTKRFRKDDDVLFPYTYNQMYYKICCIGMEIPPGVSTARWTEFKGPWWCHRVRSERACQMIRDYRYDTFRLQKWFGWASSQMPEVYSDIMPMDLIDERPVQWR